MAVEIATATNYIDLLKRLKTFVSEILTPATERWSVLRWMGFDQILRSSEAGGSEALLAFEGRPGGWRTAVNQAAPSHLGVRLVSPVDPGRIVMQGDVTPTCSPRDFALEGSDDGVNWTVRQSWTGITWSASETKTFMITAGSMGAKPYWRLRVSANNGAAQTGIQEWTLDEAVGINWLNHAVAVQLILKGPGLAGTDEIFVGLQAYALPTSDIYNLRVAGFTGFVAGNTFATQPGSSGALGVPLWNAQIPYWLVVSGRRIVCVAKVETTYQVFYLGKFLPYATPNQYPYPVVAAAMLGSDSATRYSDPGLSMPFKGARPQLKMRFVDGAWREPQCWPYNAYFNLATNLVKKRDTLGSYALEPVILYDGSPNVYGELDGIYFVPGFGQAVENRVQAGGTDYLVVQDVYRTADFDYFALKLA